MDYERFLSAEAKRFTTASLADLMHRFAGVEGVISLAAGLPPAEAFPVSELSAVTVDGMRVVLGAEGRQAFLAQQYNFNPQGYDPLLNWLRNLTVLLHGAAPAGAPPCSSGPPPPLRDLVLTSGAIHAIFAIVSCLTEPGDTLVVDEYTYTHALECVFLPRGLRLLPVRGDGEGLDPEDLDRRLRCAARAAEAGECRRPRLLYTIPTGHNPTSANLSEQRKRRILEVCEAHDLLILEDDAYYWLYYPSEGEEGEEGAEEGASCLSEGVAGPGYRLGWITAPQPLVAKLATWVQASTVGPCSAAQVLVGKLLQQWGLAGFQAHVGRLQALYAARAAAAHAAAVSHLRGLAEWRRPAGGMFMWLQLLGGLDAAAVVDELVAAKVVVVPGSLFATRGVEIVRRSWMVLVGQATLEPPEAAHQPADGGGHVALQPSSGGGSAGSPSGGCCLRLSFAGCAPEVFSEGVARLASVIRTARSRCS
ncbi:hypothetical protein VOLCADRAFT_119422 [Volvox carteri f. nagariensis]|uniref:Aminotransferase class I/classII large domain-containing protein n=1 Tax=Volvox carteri f. nagariensis TaxID=3068 RepID=D8UD03_VOLCA|nr:uncharacterized protein VOLCADRAFT_119422 [Volvox carteri f. nagariensis]EFJ42431.1 hypothetical protein VOLCADRAFT_119422 [Volvox carteri f. nagariensis]|eukprot:XP_002956494.1 hypothetical protein VOLCADRAFT_119422 [Volvox carteri f. nagariensis]